MSLFLKLLSSLFLHLWPCVCPGALSGFSMTGALQTLNSSFCIIYITYYVTQHIMLHILLIGLGLYRCLLCSQNTGMDWDRKNKNKKTLAVLAQMASYQSVEHQPTQPLCSPKQFPSSCWNDHFVLGKKKNLKNNPEIWYMTIKIYAWEMYKIAIRKVEGKSEQEGVREMKQRKDDNAV